MLIRVQASPRLNTGARVFLDLFILGFNDVILLVVGDVLVDSEAHVVTSSISRFAGPTQFFESAHRCRVCVRAFLEVSARPYM